MHFNQVENYKSRFLLAAAACFGHNACGVHRQNIK
jgi:hypothetical protein